MDYILYTLNSFTNGVQGGNKAGVVFDRNLNAEEKQEIAKYHNFSEIAFLNESKIADFKVEYYTPTSEIDMCGHATIAMFGLMKLLDIIDNGDYTLETLVGVIDIIVKDDLIYMQQLVPEFGEVIDDVIIANSLNINTSDIDDVLACQKVSTGLVDIIVPIKSLEILKNIEPDFDKVSKISKKHESVGYHLFCKEGKDIYTRNFAPLYGINEESATGSASGALAAYLNGYELLSLNKDIVFKQGYYMNQPSNINVKLVGEEDIEIVYVGGTVSTYKKEFYNTQR